MNSYKVTNEQSHGFYIIEIVQGPFKGVKYTYGKVEIHEEHGEGILSFETSVIEGEIDSSLKEEFNKMAGDNLVDIIEEQLRNNEIVYAGGIEEE